MSKMSRRILALVMTAAMLASMSVNVLAATYTDVAETDWAYEYIEAVTAKGWFTAVEDGKFGADQAMKRGDIVAVLGRMANITTPDYVNRATFRDVSTKEDYHPYIEWAYEEGIVKGYGDGKFGPEDHIYREDLCALVYNFAKWLKYDFEKVNTKVEFSDGDEISAHAVDAVAVMQQAGLIEGYEGRFNPEGTASRGDLAKLSCILGNLAADELAAVTPTTATYTAPNYDLCYVKSVDAAKKTAEVYVDGVLGTYTIYNYNSAYNYGGVMTCEAGEKTGELRLYDQVKQNKTVRYLATAEDATALNDKIKALGTGYSGTNAKNWSYGSVAHRLNFEQGIYINGNKTEMAEKVGYYAVNADGTLTVLDGAKDAYVSTLTKATAIAAYMDTGIFANKKTEDGHYISKDGYAYAAAEYDDEGKLTAVYYTAEASQVLDYDTSNVIIRDFYMHDELNTLITKQPARYQMDPSVETFVSAEIYVDGAANTYAPLDFSGKLLTLKNEKTDTEASMVYAKNKGVVTLGAFNFEHLSRSEWTKIAFERQTDGASTEVSMQYGPNAIFYAMGGSIYAGDDNVRSYVFAAGDNANGIFAGTTGGVRTAEDADPTSTVKVKNTDFRLWGWNNHVADTVYGGYVYLENVNGVTGIPGRSAVGQSTPLANDFGSGVVEAYNCKFQAWAARSAGIYAIGNGKIVVEDSLVDTYQSGALVSSGGQFWVRDTKAHGPMAVRVRGGGTSNYDLFIENSELITEMRLEGTSIDVITGEPVDYAFYGTHNMTEEELATYTKNTMVGKVNVGQYFWEMSDTDSVLAGTEYSDKEPYMAGTMYDNLLYNYSTCEYEIGGKYQYMGDYVSVPYLTPGVFNGMVGSVITYDNETQHMVATNNTYINKNAENYGDAYNYLLSAENGGGAIVDFVDHDETLTGLIWNQGVKTTETKTTRKGTSSIQVNFHNSDFTGSFADGYNGLWEGPVEYTDCKGNKTKLNGNFWCAEGNWGIKAGFDADSVWTVTHDSYLGELTLLDANSIKAPAGKTLVMYVNGVKTEIRAGTYSGQVVILVVDAVNDITDYTITVETAEGGVVTAPAAAKYLDGVKMTVAATEGYDVKAINVKTASGETVTVSTDTMSFIMPRENVTVTPVFAGYYDETEWPGEYKVQIVTEGKGSAVAYAYNPPSGPNKASLGGEIRRADAGSKANVAIIATPAAGFKVASMTYTDAEGNAQTVTAPNGGNANYYNFIMPGADTTVTVTFERIVDNGMAQIGASVFEYLGETGGTITCGKNTASKGAIKVPATGEFTLNFVPDEGYGVIMVIKNGAYAQGSGLTGTVMGAPTSLTFKSVEEVESVQVIFGQIAAETAFDFAAGTISGYTGPGTYPFVRYPQAIGGTAVTTMGTNASYRCEGVFYAVPEGVTTIKGAAFGDLVECEHFVMPTTLTDVAEDWLAGGTGATFYFPKAVYDKYDFLQSNSKVVAY